MRSLRRIVIAVIGGTVVAIGLAMTVLPGPAIIVIPTGLAILATEFAWARHLLRRMKEKTAKVTGAGRGRNAGHEGGPNPAREGDARTPGA